jgi:hypothetical protein
VLSTSPLDPRGLIELHFSNDDVLHRDGVKKEREASSLYLIPLSLRERGGLLFAGGERSVYK